MFLLIAVLADDDFIRIRILGILIPVRCITGMSLEKLSKAIWGPFATALVVLLLITFIPGLRTFLSRILMG